MRTNLEWEDAINLYKRLGFTEFQCNQHGVGLELWLKRGQEPIHGATA